MKRTLIGSTFDDFLKEEGIHDEATALAVKRTIVRQLDQARIEQGLTKQDLVARMHTSRSQLDRLLDPGNAQIRLDTLRRAADALGRRLVIELV